MIYVLVWVLFGVFTANHALWHQAYRKKTWLRFQLLGFACVLLWPAFIVIRMFLFMHNKRVSSDVYTPTSKHVVAHVRPSHFATVIELGSTSVILDANTAKQADTVELTCALGTSETYTVRYVCPIDNGLDFVVLYKDHIF